MANAPSLSLVADPSRPRKLGRYELEERLGGEDGAETFRARVRGLAGFDRIFAVKCLRRPRGSQVNLNDPFIKTARRLAGLNDPRVARVLDADLIDGVAVAVTEFVHGLDLDRFRECAQYAGVLATGNDEAAAKWQKIVAYVGAEVAGGLSVLHALTPPLVHGGLSPRNVVATARGGIKLLDAGLAQAADPIAPGSSKRALVYAAISPDGAESSPKADVRALGAMLFELATGELPASPSQSSMVRAVLDSLWPAMADFIAGLLAEDPALRPSAAEAAKFLADYWSDIPDASMVTEMASLVRNFSAFVTEAGVPMTAPPVVHPPPPPVPEARPAEVLPLNLQPPPVEAAPASPPNRGFAEAEPTVVKPDGDYASALFAATANEPEVDEPLLFDDPPPPPAPPVLRPNRPTMMAYPAVDGLFPTPPAPPPPVTATSFEPEAAMPSGPPIITGLAPLTPAAPSETIPELADWGAQALAVLGQEAGVAIAPLAPSPAPPTTSEPPPPPVKDPTIEAAFAFTPPAPADTPPEEPMLEAVAEIEPDPALEPGPPEPPTSWNRGGAVMLEDELVEAGAESVPASEEQEPGTSELANPASLEASAFEEAVPAQDEAPEMEEPLRLAQAMDAPKEAEERYPESRAAAASDGGLSDIDAEALANSTRGKRVAMGVAVFLLVGSAVFGGLAVSGVFAKKHPAAAVPAKMPGKPTKAALPASAPVAGEAAANPKPAREATKPEPSAPAAKERVEAKAAPAPSAPEPKHAGPSNPEKAAATGPTVSVSVASKPPGATVWIDGEERGTTPCSVTLARGTANLTLVLAGHLTSASAFEASDGKTVEQTLQPVAPPLEGEARFRAECKTTGKLPIVVDGHETGILCPYSKMRVAPGAHSIGVLLPATGKVHAKEITLSPGVRSIMFAD